MSEVWKSIPGLDGFYEASDVGRIRSVQRWTAHRGGAKRLQGGVILKQATCTNGYKKVIVSVRGRISHPNVHRLILLAFVGKPKRGQQCRHLNGKKIDNRALNLCWGTVFENANDRKKHGGYKSGAKHQCAKLTNNQAKYILSSKKKGTQLSTELGISESHISNIRHGRNWRELKKDSSV